MLKNFVSIQFAATYWDRQSIENTIKAIPGLVKVVSVCPYITSKHDDYDSADHADYLADVLVCRRLQTIDTNDDGGAYVEVVCTITPERHDEVDTFLSPLDHFDFEYSETV